MKKVLVFVLFTVFSLVAFVSKPAYAKDELKNSYIYNFWGEAVPSAPGYELERVINVKEYKGLYNAFSSLQDIFVTDDRIFLVDKSITPDVPSQIIILDHDFNFIERFYLLKDQDGKIFSYYDQATGQMVQDRIIGPEGIFVTKDGDLYVADTAYRDKNDDPNAIPGARIIHFSIAYDRRGNPFYYVKRIIRQPENMIGKTEFLPSKLVVDKADRIYAVVRGGNEGIIELNADGSFSRYFGVNKMRVNLVDYFWKRFASDVQKEKMTKVYAPPFNNLDMDADGFIYATSSDQNTIDFIKRINPSGEDVLVRRGYFSPSGDLQGSTTTVFVSVSVNDYGMYALLDETTGHVFIYNFDGELLTIIGEKGSTKGSSIQPVDVAWLGDKILVADAKNGRISVYRPTEFGKLVLDATKAYYQGEWDLAGNLWLEVINHNANYDIAYVGYGKMLYMNEQYKEAKDYFKLGNNRTYYSMAFKKYRNDILRDNFWLFITPIVLAAVWVVYTEYKYNRKGGSN